MVGDHALVAFDDVVVVNGRHEKFGLPKTLFAIGTGHSPHEIRNLRIHAATANPDWKETVAERIETDPAEDRLITTD